MQYLGNSLRVRDLYLAKPIEILKHAVNIPVSIIPPLHGSRGLLSMQRVQRDNVILSIALCPLHPRSFVDRNARRNIPAVDDSGSSLYFSP